MPYVDAWRDVGWGWMAMGWIWMFAFWEAVIGLALWGIPRLTRGGSASNLAPLDITKARYAHGEISKEEFQRLKQDPA